ncbi:hypothetical protein [Nostoc sp. TCL240-02]|uniref:hypothetical protein n=1 Tax=Nostoc sp. TCL240-02 TaxID=2572090 RepID=UPI00157F9D33|nr:hypothetical protein [Nostoc sp. TCL240-02]QKQ75659.1 hypothetical protein FBB35_22290 [Nostoc sp. TCL240-02]
MKLKWRNLKKYTIQFHHPKFPYWFSDFIALSEEAALKEARTIWGNKCGDIAVYAVSEDLRLGVLPLFYVASDAQTEAY